MIFDSVIYNSARIIFSESNNHISINHLNFIDKSIDLDPNSENDIEISQATNLGFSA